MSGKIGLSNYDSTKSKSGKGSSRVKGGYDSNKSKSKSGRKNSGSPAKIGLKGIPPLVKGKSPSPDRRRSVSPEKPGKTSGSKRTAPASGSKHKGSSRREKGKEKEKSGSKRDKSGGGSKREAKKEVKDPVKDPNARMAARAERRRSVGGGDGKNEKEKKRGGSSRRKGKKDNTVIEVTRKSVQDIMAIREENQMLELLSDHGLNDDGFEPAELATTPKAGGGGFLSKLTGM